MPIGQDNFKQICAAVGVDWEKVVDWQRVADWKKNPKNLVDNSFMAQICLKEDCNEMPDVHLFGRKKELEDLKQSILQNRPRVVTLCGSPGIGKTTLAARLTEEVKSDFKYFSWRKLNNSSAPTLLNLLSSLVEVLSGEENTNLRSNNVDDLITKLLKIFATHRVLLVLDGWENILPIQGVEASQRNYEKYGELLRLLAERRHQSCVIITTQKEPDELYLLKDTPPVNLIRLPGLDFEASLKILETKQLKFTQQQADKLINKDYKGNPLALRHICEHIQRVFAGSVTKYENNHTFLVPVPFETAIIKNCESLCELEAKILQILAKESTSIDYDKLKSQIQNSSKLSDSDLQTNLSSLLMRSLIERNSQGDKILFGLQNIVRKCIRKFYKIS